MFVLSVISDSSCFLALEDDEKPTFGVVSRRADRLDGKDGISASLVCLRDENITG